MPTGISNIDYVFTAGKAIRADHGPYGVVWFWRPETNEYQHFKNDSIGAVDRDIVERAVGLAEAVETVPVSASPFGGE